MVWRAAYGVCIAIIPTMRRRPSGVDTRQERCGGLYESSTTLNHRLYIQIYIMNKLKQIELTLQEWWEALKTPSPTRNKKKYKRKAKHKKKEDWRGDL
jgi:hypothetical protein